MLEKTVENKIKIWLRDHGCIVSKYHGTAYTVSGHPDLFGCLPGGRFFGIEVKAPGRTPSITQRMWIDNINDHGGIAFFADSLQTVIDKISPLLD